MRSPRQLLGRWFVRLITQTRRNYQRFVFNDPEKLKATIAAGDVLLVDGDQRVSQAVKYLTQATWSPSALFIGDALLRRDPDMAPQARRRFCRGGGSPHVAALVEGGGVVLPLL